MLYAVVSFQQFYRGETKTVSFTLTPDDLALFNIDMNWTVEPGEFKVFVGISSEEVLENSFSIQ